MPIDGVDVRNSPAWWMRRMFHQLGNRDRQNRLKLLTDYARGNPPLPEVTSGVRSAYEQFQRYARSNFAELIVSACSERMTPVGFRTKLDDDEGGDREVGELWQRAGLDVESADVHDMMLTVGEAYVIVGEEDEDLQAPVITCEDPTWMVAEPDAAQPRTLRAALKVLYDEVDRQDRAYLFLPGRSTNSGMAELHVAYRSIGAAGWVERAESATSTTTTRVDSSGNLSTTLRTPLLSFSPQSWNWDTERSMQLSHPRIPVVRFCNKDTRGEFEAHTDLLRRVNHQILQRMVITVLQAFRQRAVRGLPLKDPKTGELIDYSEVFSMDPAALWQLPETAQMWESGQVDLTPILTAVKDDVTHLAACTRTPMHLLLPAGANQSAEAAALQREGLVFKTRDRIARSSLPWAQVMSLALQHAGMADRADITRLRTMWAPPEHLSLAERADAASKAANDIPRRSRLIHVWQFTPSEADRMMSEWADDELLAAQVAAATAATPAEPEPTAGPGTPPEAATTPPAAGDVTTQPPPAIGTTATGAVPNPPR